MLAAAPGERLRTLRELLGMTQSQLSKVSGVSQAWISSAETGAREATIDGIRAIATATGTPYTFFEVQPSSVPLDSLRFRKSASASRVVTKRIHAFYGESYRVSDTLLTKEKYPSPPLPYATKESLSDSEVEDFAELTREALRLAPDKPIPHLTRAMERAGVAVARLILPEFQGGNDEDSSDTASDDGAPRTSAHYGVSYWGGVGEAALVGYFPGSQGDRDRFTLAHELGHLVLHTFRPRAQDAEDEANRFAAAILMPYDRATRDFSNQLSLADYARLKATWGISIQALVMRAFAADAISETRKRSLFVQLSSKGWRKNEPVVVGQELPLLLWTLLSRQFGARPHVTAAEKLAIHPTVLRSIAPAPSSHDDGRFGSPQTVVEMRPRVGVQEASSTTGREHNFARGIHGKWRAR